MDHVKVARETESGSEGFLDAVSDQREESFHVGFTYPCRHFITNPKAASNPHLPTRILKFDSILKRFL